MADDRWIAEAVDLIDSRLWVVLEGMHPEDADVFFEALDKSIADTKEAYFEHIDGPAPEDLEEFQ